MDTLKFFGYFCIFLIFIKIFPGFGGKTTSYIYILLGFALASFTIYGVCDAWVRVKSNDESIDEND